MAELIISQAEFEQRFPFKSLKQVLLYGSMVFAQEDSEKQSSAGNLVDSILIVDDTDNFHDENFDTNRRDYPFGIKASSLFGLTKPWLAKSLQRKGAGVMYHTNVEIGGEHTKYGIVGVKTYIDDLENWTTLYMAGRAHKMQHVVHINDEDVSERLKAAREANLGSAINVALLLNAEQETISERDLYRTIVGISYIGDVRDKVGAKGKDKEEKLLRQMDSLRGMYTPILQRLVEEGVLTRIDDGEVSFSLNLDIDSLLAGLPSNLLERLSTDGSNVRDMIDDIRNSIAHINSEASTVQALKGVASAGIWTSLQYASAKLLKGKLKGSKGEELIRKVMRL